MAGKTQLEDSLKFYLLLGIVTSPLVAFFIYLDGIKVIIPLIIVAGFGLWSHCVTIITRQSKIYHPLLSIPFLGFCYLGFNYNNYGKPSFLLLLGISVGFFLFSAIVLYILEKNDGWNKGLNISRKKSKKR
ncbi:MAG: hypothetical protein GY810_27010 [Aureispira sp.]|nr:hypothetical protein [Aureispira sp.]